MPYFEFNGTTLRSESDHGFRYKLSMRILWNSNLVLASSRFSERVTYSHFSLLEGSPVQHRITNSTTAKVSLHRSRCLYIDTVAPNQGQWTAFLRFSSEFIIFYYILSFFLYFSCTLRVGIRIRPDCVSTGSIVFIFETIIMFESTINIDLLMWFIRISSDIFCST